MGSNTLCNLGIQGPQSAGERACAPRGDVLGVVVGDDRARFQGFDETFQRERGEVWNEGMSYMFKDLYMGRGYESCNIQ